MRRIAVLFAVLGTLGAVAPAAAPAAAGTGAGSGKCGDIIPKLPVNVPLRHLC